jgi:hypothetical protein
MNVSSLAAYKDEWLRKKIMIRLQSHEWGGSGERSDGRDGIENGADSTREALRVGKK